MKIEFLFGVFVLLLLPLSIATECDDFCADEGYDYGTCRDTVEEGFCEGNENEKVFGFSQCTDVQRCCCGYEEESVDTIEDIEEKDFSISEFAENAFWFLLAIVAVLGLIVIINKIAFNDKREDEKNEEKL